MSSLILFVGHTCGVWSTPPPSKNKMAMGFSPPFEDMYSLVVEILFQGLKFALSILPKCGTNSGAPIYQKTSVSNFSELRVFTVFVVFRWDAFMKERKIRC